MRVAIIIPALDRVTHLKRTIACLRFQTYPLVRITVIVVQDNQLPKASLGEIPGINVLHIRSADFGGVTGSAAAARNLGARLSPTSTDLFVFLDCDMLAHPDLIDNHVAVHSGAEDQFYVGLGWRWHLPSRARYPNFGAITESEYIGWVAKQAVVNDERDSFLTGCEPNWGCLYAHNFSIRPQLFFGLNGFDERFVGCGVEDVEFGYRLHSRKAKFLVVRKAPAYHQFHPRSAIRWRANIANLSSLAAKHPTLKSFCAEVIADWRVKMPKRHLRDLDALDWLNLER